MNRNDLKLIQSDISELIFYAKDTYSGNVSHKMPSILNRLNEIDTKLKNILFSEVDDRTQDEKDIQEFISKDDIVPTKKFTIGTDVSKENTNQPYNSANSTITYSDVDMLNFAKWALSNIKYCYDFNLEKWWVRKTFKFKTWEEIFNIYKDEISNKNNNM
jgi:hypothetical protein